MEEVLARLTAQKVGFARSERDTVTMHAAFGNVAVQIPKMALWYAQSLALAHTEVNEDVVFLTEW